MTSTRRSSCDWSRLLCMVMATLAIACTPTPSKHRADAPGPSAAAGTQTLRLREGCPFKRWDSVDVVKAFYGVAYDPIEEPSPLAGNSPESRAFYRSGYYYRFPELGVSIFFGADLRILSVRFDRPFTGKIGGVAIGTTGVEVERIKGKPARTFMPAGRGFPDPEFLDLQQKRKQAIVDALPDPVPKQDVVRALQALTAIDKEPLQFTTPFTYHAGTENFVRYDLGHSGTVQIILAASCVVE